MYLLQRTAHLLEKSNKFRHMSQQVGNLLKFIKQVFPLLKQIGLDRNIDIIQQMTNLLQQINYMSEQIEYLLQQMENLLHYKNSTFIRLKKLPLHVKK